MTKQSTIRFREMIDFLVSIRGSYGEELRWKIIPFRRLIVHFEQAPLPYGGAALLPAHEIEDRLAVLNVRRILQDPKAAKARRDAAQATNNAAERAKVAAAMARLDQMRGG